MHYVDRGPEPQRLAALRENETPKWVAYARRRRCTRPSEKPWRRFEPLLRKVFHALCGYCEGVCKGQIDHFRPKRRFPQLVYRWSNWVYCCPTCNQAKADKWPPGGFVNPCATIASQRPERFFGYDTLAGTIRPKTGLRPARRRKAEQTIRELNLNGFWHVKLRRWHLFVVSQALSQMAPTDPLRQAFVRRIAARTQYLSSITRALLIERGYRPQDLHNDA